MLIELSNNNHIASKQEIFEYYDFTMKNDVSLLSVFPYYTTYFSDLSKISLMIDHPYGCGDVSSRENAVYIACKTGVKAVDVVVNQTLLNNEEYGKILHEMRSLYKCCQDYGVKLRIVVDHRFTEVKIMQNLAKLLKNENITYWITSTMLFVDDYCDNLVAAERVSSMGMKTICSSSMWLERHVPIFLTTKNYAIKTNSIKFIKIYMNLVYNIVGKEIN